MKRQLIKLITGLRREGAIPSLYFTAIQIESTLKKNEGGDVRRRNLLRLFLLMLSVAATPRKLRFQAQYTVDLEPFSDWEEFTLYRSQYEFSDKIKLVNEKFRRSNKLIDFSFDCDSKRALWTYTFDSEQSFKEWDSALINESAVCHRGRRYLPHRTLDHVLV